MARKDPTQNGHDRLDEAMAMLIQNQAAFVGRQAKTDRLLAEYERRTSESIAGIKADMAAILRVLGEHSRMLERLPETIREKIGFKAT